MRRDTLIGALASSAGLVIGLAACLDPVDPMNVTVASVQVIFDGGAAVDTVRVRGTVRAHAIAVAPGGYDLGRTDFTYASSNNAVAIVESNGVVRGMAPGTATIRASIAGGPAGEATIVVVPSTVEYTIPVGDSPGAMAFSPDYTRLYVAIAPDSLAIVDALGYIRLSAVRVGLPITGVAATSQAIYVTHAAADSISVILPANNSLAGRISVGSGPVGATATADRAFFAVRGDRRIAIVEPGRATLAIQVGGEPHDVVVSRDGRRLFATVDAGGGAWRLVIVDPATRDTLHSLPLSSRPGAVTTDISGGRAYVLLPAEQRVAVIAEGSGGVYSEVGTVAVGAGAGGISARLTGVPLVVASGAPLTVFDGGTMTVLESVADVGSGHVAIRPDGFFAFVSTMGSNVLRVIGL